MQRLDLPRKEASKSSKTELIQLKLNLAIEPADLSSRDRFLEIAKLFATGLLRLSTRKLIPLF